jgi:ketopantoate reductase
MARNILILGASYGSLLATKLLMAGHNVTLVCRKQTAELINRDGTEVRTRLRMRRPPVSSRDLPDPDAVEPATSILPAMIWLVLRCRNRNTPTMRSRL